MGKLLATLWTILAIAVPFDDALAAGNHWFALDRKAKRVVEWQENQEKRFQALEADSVKLLKKIEAAGKIVQPGR